MPFSDKAAEDARSILLDCAEFSEVVQYQNHTASGAQPWKSVTVLIEDEDNVLPALGGAPWRRGPRSIFVSVLKDAVNGIVEPRKEVDRIRRYPGTTKEQVFTVMEIPDPTDPGWWRLYAAP